MTTKKTWLYLEWLRRSGQTNMYGAVPYLMEEFWLDEKLHDISVRNLFRFESN